MAWSASTALSEAINLLEADPVADWAGALLVHVDANTARKAATRKQKLAFMMFLLWSARQ
jgi:hypothetical protein